MAPASPSKLMRRLVSGRHVSIRLLLVALVCVPVLAVGLSGGLNIDSASHASQVEEARTATLRLVGQVDAARTAAESLSLPVIASEVASNPGLSAQFNIPADMLPAARSVYPPAEVARERQAAIHQLQAIDLKTSPARWRGP